MTDIFEYCLSHYGDASKVAVFQWYGDTKTSRCSHPFPHKGMSCFRPELHTGPHEAHFGKHHARAIWYSGSDQL